MFVYSLLLSTAIFLIVFLSFLNYVLIDISFSLTWREESTSYECGFEHHSLSRLPLSVRYFFLTIIFLIFDVEVIFLSFLPISLASNVYLSFTLLVVFLFLLFLFLGLLYEWLDGSLDWVM